MAGKFGRQRGNLTHNLCDITWARFKAASLAVLRMAHFPFCSSSSLAPTRTSSHHHHQQPPFYSRRSNLLRIQRRPPPRLLPLPTPTRLLYVATYFYARLCLCQYEFRHAPAALPGPYSPTLSSSPTPACAHRFASRFVGHRRHCCCRKKKEKKGGSKATPPRFPPRHLHPTLEEKKQNKNA